MTDSIPIIMMARHRRYKLEDSALHKDDRWFIQTRAPVFVQQFTTERELHTLITSNVIFSRFLFTPLGLGCDLCHSCGGFPSVGAGMLLHMSTGAQNGQNLSGQY